MKMYLEFALDRTMKVLEVKLKGMAREIKWNFRGDAPDHQADASRLPGAVNWVAGRPTSGVITEEVNVRARGSPSSWAGSRKAMAGRIRWLVTECREGRAR